MPTSRWLAVPGMLALLIASGCSDGDDVVARVPRAQEIAFTESQLALALPLMAEVVSQIAPPSPAPRSQVGVAGDGCVIVDRGNCDSGTVSECSTAEPDVVDIQVDQCTRTQGSTGASMTAFDGLLTYTAGQAWPTGTLAMVVDDDAPGEIRYDTTFDGTSVAQLTVVDTVNGIEAICSGGLEAGFDVFCY